MENEEKTSASSEKETTSENAPGKEEGEKSETESPISEARNLAERIEKANLEYKKLLEREEKLHADKILSGKSVSVRNEKKEETPKEYAEKILRGEITK